MKISGLFYNSHYWVLHWGIAFTTIESVFLFELLKLKLYKVQWIKQQTQKWEFKMKISPALK